MGFMEEYYKALAENNQKNSSASSGGSGGSGGSSSGGSGFMADYYRAVGNTKTSSNNRSSVYSRDIAPLAERVASRMTVSRKEEEEKKKRKWFEKGLFEDGYDIGDISRTILGTTADVLENVGSGIIGMGIGRAHV